MRSAAVGEHEVTLCESVSRWDPTIERPAAKLLFSGVVGSSRMRVRRAILGDEPILRELRLQALSDAPEAFGSTYERELARTTTDWQRWMSPGVAFMLEDSEGPRGIVAGQYDPADPAIVHLMAMWVHPMARGSGAGDLLVAAVFSWARTERARAIRLDVVHSNARARRFYERNGFRVTGRQVVRERDGQIEVQMECLVERGMPESVAEDSR